MSKKAISFIMIMSLAMGLMSSQIITAANSKEPVKVILDTDNGPDCGDAATIAMLHGLAEKNEVEILGVMACTSDEYNAPCIDAINTYYGRPDIPIGTLKDKGFLAGPWYSKNIAANWPNDLQNGKNAPDATELYRKLLSEQPDNSVAIVAVGPLRNLRKLLESGPDKYSPLNGIELVKRKVKVLSCMGGWFPSVPDGQGPEWNFAQDGKSAKYVNDNWPTHIMYSGAEIGWPIMTGDAFFRDTPLSNPIRRAFQLFGDAGYGGARPSWDQTSLLYAVRGLSNYWDTEGAGINEISADGSNKWVSSPGGNHSYLKQKMPIEELEDIIEEIMLSAKPASGEKPVAKPSPAPIPVKIQAENFIAKKGIHTIKTEDIGLGLRVGWIDKGNWMDYRVNVEKAGTYTVFYRTASNNSSGKLQLQKADGTVLHAADVPNSGDYNKFVNIARGKVNLSAGAQTLRLYVVEGGWDLNWFVFIPGDIASMPEIGGLKGEYFDNSDFTKLVTTRTDKILNYNWGTRAPIHKNMGDGTFSIRWTGMIEPVYSEKYTFNISVSGGVKLWIDGKLVINQWKDLDDKEYNGVVSLVGGRMYNIKLEYFNNTGPGKFKLSWSSKSQKMQIVPREQLSAVK